MVFVDSNIPMYYVGRDQPSRAAAQALLDDLVRNEVPLVTSVEVIQEILHRYSATRRLEAIAPAVDLLLEICDQILDITLADVLAAQRVLLQGAKISARDALHIAVMQRESVDTILSFDRGFDAWPGIKRLGS